MAEEIATLRAALRNNPEHHAKLRELAESGAIGPMTEVPTDQPLTVIAAPEHFGIEGAQQARCSCGLIVWLSPSTQRMIIARGAAPHPVRVLCAWCFITEIRKSREIVVERTQ